MSFLPSNPSTSTIKRNPHLYGIAAQSSANNITHDLKPKTLPKRIRQSSKPLLNKLELEFEHHLEWVLNKHEARPQAITFKLANGLRYTPDFTWDLSESYEVKGKHAWDDSIAKLKMAATAYPEITWWLAWKENKEWKIQRVLP